MSEHFALAALLVVVGFFAMLEDHLLFAFIMILFACELAGS